MSVQVTSLSSSDSGILPVEKDIGRQKIKRLDTAIKVFAVISLASFITTIVLLVLAQLNFVHSLSGAYAMGVSLCALFVIKLINCCQESTAKRYRIDLEKENAKLHPMPKRKQEDKKGKKP